MKTIYWYKQGQTINRLTAWHFRTLWKCIFWVTILLYLGYRLCTSCFMLCYLTNYKRYISPHGLPMSKNNTTDNARYALQLQNGIHLRFLFIWLHISVFNNMRHCHIPRIVWLSHIDISYFAIQLCLFSEETNKKFYMLRFRPL